MSHALPIAYWQQGRHEPDGYIWCRHVKRYLRWQFSNCEIQPFVDAVDFQDYNGLENALNDWLDLKKPIPITFMDAIGVDLELVKTILEIDEKEFNQSLRRAATPKLFWVEDVNEGLIPHVFPVGTTEADSIAHIEQFLRSTPNACAYLHWPGLRTIVFEGGRATFTAEYRPRLTVDDAYYSFGKDGSTLPARSS